MRKKLQKAWAWIKERPYCVRRAWVRRRIKSRDFTIISNNCWAGRVYQYLDMPYLSPTVGLYFFAEEYVKFVSDLRHYLETPLRFIPAEESKYRDMLKWWNHMEKPIGVLDDVEIVFLHYSNAEEAMEKWNRRVGRINYDHLIIKFSNMNMCTEEHIARFDQLPFERKFVLNNRKKPVYKSEVYWPGYDGKPGILMDTKPFPGKLNLVSLLQNRWRRLDNCEKKGVDTV